MLKTLLNTILFLIFSVIVVNVLASEESHTPTKEVWKIACLDWEPYTGKNLPNNGESIAKLRKILADNGIELHVEFMPWARAKQLVKHSDSFHGIYPAWPVDTFEGSIVSEPVEWHDLVVMKNSEKKLQYNDLDDLFKNYSVGLISSYVYPEKIMELKEKYPQNIRLTKDEKSLMKKLSLGRSDAAITDPKVMLYLAEKEKMSNIEVAKHIQSIGLVVAFRNDYNGRYLKFQLDKMLAQSRQSTPNDQIRTQN